MGKGMIHSCESPLAIENMECIRVFQVAQEMRIYIFHQGYVSVGACHSRPVVLLEQIVLGMLFKMWNQARAHDVLDCKAPKWCSVTPPSNPQTTNIDGLFQHQWLWEFREHHWFLCTLEEILLLRSCMSLDHTWSSYHPYLDGGLEHFFAFPYMGNHDPSWLSCFSEG